MSMKPLQTCNVGDWRYIATQQKLVRLDENNIVYQTAELDNLSQNVLYYFIRNAGKLITKEELLRDVWGIRDVSDGRISRVISVIRTELGDDSREPRYIETIPKRGYRFIAPVTFLTDVVQEATAQKPVVEPRWDFRHNLPGMLVIVLVVSAVILFWRYAFYEEQTPAEAAPPLWRHTSITSMDGLEFYHNVSADERYLVFSYADPQAENIIVLLLQDLQTHQRTRLTSDEYSSLGAVFSPDMRQIAYQRLYPDKSCEIRLLSLSDDKKSVLDDRLLTPCGESSVSARISWSPDGNYLLFSSMDAAKKQMILELFSLQIGVTEQLTIPPASSFGDYVGRFSRKGDKIVFLRDAGGVAQIWIMDLASRATRLLVQVAGVYPSNVDWSVDDKSIIYPSVMSLSRIELAGGAPEILAYTDEQMDEIQLSSSGRIFATVGSFSRVNIRKLPNPVTNTQQLNDSLFSSSRDEFYVAANPQATGPVAVVSGRSGLAQVWFFYADGSQKQMSHFQQAERFRNISFSPDGNTLLVQTGNDLWLFSETQPARKIVAGEQDMISFPSWSRDGSRVHYAVSHLGRWQIMSVDPENPQLRQVLSAEKMFYLESNHSPYYLWRNAVDKQFYIEQPGQPAQKLPSYFPEDQIWFSFDIRQQGIYYVVLDGSSYQLFYYDFSSASSRLIKETLYLGRFSISADEQFIYVPEFAYGDIDIAEIEIL